MTEQSTGPYAAGASVYWQAGFRGILPLPARAKKHPPKGTTGGIAKGWPSWPDVTAWTEQHPEGNLALRLPEGFVGIDVDCWDGKPGAATFARLVELYGPVPATWTSTSREDGSRIMLFRCPPGLAWPGDLKVAHEAGALAGTTTGGIEVITCRYRYVVAWPSIHPDTGRTYTWYRPDGLASVGEVPALDDLPDLPDAWVQGLTGGQLVVERDRIELDAAGSSAWLQENGQGAPCRQVARALSRYLSDLSAGTGSRHELAKTATSRLTLLASEGHTGALAALQQLYGPWLAATAGDRQAGEAAAEWGRLVDGAIAIAAARPASMRTQGDPCTSPLHGGTRSQLPSLPGAPGAGLPPLVPAQRVSGAQAALSVPPAPVNVTAPAPTVTPSAFGPPVAADEPDPDADEQPVADLFSQPIDLTPEELEALNVEAERLQFEAFVEHELKRRRIQDEARRRLRAEGAVEAPEPMGLSDMLAIDDPPARWRIEGLMTRHARVLLSAAFKAGKSTLVQNALRCLVDGGLLMGTWNVMPVETGRRVALVDNELDVDELRQSLREQQIVNTGAVTVVSLRGKVASFNLTDEHVLKEWAAKFRALDVDVLIFDCLRPVLDAIGLKEGDEAGVFLVAFDRLLDEAGISEAIVVHHAGHEGERARGDSRLRDWPDQEWRLVREKTGDGTTIDPAAKRYFAAYGRRGVNVPEGELSYEESSRRLFYNTGGRSDKKINYAVEAVISILRDASIEGDGPLSGRDIEARAKAGGHTRDPIRRGLKAAVDRRLVKVTYGPKRAELHELMPLSEANGLPVLDVIGKAVGIASEGNDTPSNEGGRA